ncbi:Predicted Zn-dependent peptidase [Singulisphaera sp. GP187]|uniref:M16 family metallopeptidase n=1 Tax=Singulisphaera sp. GP187 TaxID=1882752 RepID=UPI00092CD6FD|nr:pitrilysin family protein [Singulisphaera sp. GP187]SIO57902.1 Predicted Zn-dependent peptidase [Singulisphaera sp. GP187]
MTSTLRLPELGFTKFTLANGLDVIVRRQGPLPLVAANLWYHVGSKNEERRQRGFAHLFEHLMFEGSEHYPGDFFKPLQRLGASINGSTSTDRTNYFVDLPAAHLELALAMESDRMGCLIPALTDEKLRVQKDVVKNEYRQNYANRPYGMVWRILAEALYPPGHPYSWMTIGVMEEVEAATREDVEAFFHRFYVPSNASLCLVGDLDEDRALALADRYFGSLPGGTKALRPWTPPVELARSEEILLYERVELDRYYEVWPTVAHFEGDDAPLVLLADILSRGKSSRLYRKLVVETGLAQDVTAYQSSRELAGSFGAVVTLRPGESWEKARALFHAELAHLAEYGLEEGELERVKNGRLAGYVYAMDNIGGFGGVADRLNAYNIYRSDPGWMAADLERFQATTAEAIVSVARRHLVDRPTVRLTVLGKKEPTTAPPLDRSVKPVSAAAVPFRAPSPEMTVLRCGLPLWVIPRRDLPIVAATIALGGGAGMHPPDSAGLAELTTAMMDEGTTSRSSIDLARAAEEMGTSLSTSCGWDGAYVGFQSLTPHWLTSLDLAVDVLRNPTFPESEWTRIHGQTLAGLKAERDSAEARAHRGLLRALYPLDHAYRMPIDGDEAIVARLTREDVRRFHEQFHGPSRAACIVAGDVDPAEVARALDERLSGWSGPEAPPPALASPARGQRPRILLLDKPGAPQAVVRVGHVGLPRLDPDFTDVLVLNQILGGQFTSRLNAKLREEKGFTYGVRSHFDCRRGAGPFFVGASLQSDRLAEALTDLRGEIEALVGDRPPTASELDDARRALIEGQARQFETPAALVSRYAGLFIHGLPADHHAHFAERLEAVTVDSLAATARRQIQPSALAAVVVADASVVLGPLRDLGWCEVEVDVDIS